MVTLESPHRPLRIAIVGAGVGGLTAAAALRMEGHEVHIFETSPTNKELGAAISLSANALRALTHLGFNIERLRACAMHGSTWLDSQGGEGRFNAWYDPHNTFGHYGILCHRSDLHDELKRLATAKDGPGRPATVHLNSPALSCDPETGTLTLKNGVVHHADLMLGADGIHSAIRTSVLGYEQIAPASGRAAFRCLLDITKIEGCAEFDWIDSGPPGIRGVRPQNVRGRSLVVYACRDKTLLNIVATLPDPRDQNSCNWKELATKEALLSAFADYGAQFTGLLARVDGPVSLWQIRALPVLPTWIRGRTALIGDAAHATFPTLGQGSAMAIEDAVTIACLLPRGTTAAQVPRRLQAYQTLRKPRGDFVSRESVEQVTVPAKRGLFGRSREMQAYIAGHDAAKVARDYFAAHFCRGNGHYGDPGSGARA
ncbi:FAD/NAD(P)-binding domain-containing protein [Mycena latifolia]|nr:FAD/NAD(P)-binding domain-containing protein [Mycena latifolia]